MKRKELLKQSKKLAAVITAVALMDVPVVAHATDGTATENVQSQTDDSAESVSEETTQVTEDAAPAEEAPVVEETQTEETSAEETPAEETSAEDTTTAEEETSEVTPAPVEDEIPTENEVPAEDTTTEEKTSEITPTPAEDENPAEDTTAEEKTSEVTPTPAEDEATAKDETTTGEETLEVTPTPAEEALTPTPTPVEESLTPAPTESPIATQEAKDGWVQEGDDWYYYQDGEKVTDSEVGFYDEDENWVYGRVDQDGKRMVNAWYENEYGDIYYYDSKGAQADGLTEIDGKTYYFSGSMRKDYTVVEDGVLYHFGEDGSAQVKQTIDKDGWIQVDDNWYYTKDKELVRNQLVTVGDYTYYLDYDGTMQKNASFGIYDSENNTYNYYRVDEQGHLVKGWYRTDEWSSWYYYGDDGVQANGLTTIGGKTYYFDDGMLTNYATVIDGTYYYFGDDGVLASKQSADKDGWVKSGDDWSYIKDKEIVKDDFVTVDGYTYYMNYKGVMAKNDSFGHYNDKDEWCYYRVDEKGHLVTGWYRYDEESEWYYYGTDGARAEGMTTVNGKTYYFNSFMRTNYTVVTDGTFYYFGSNGVLTNKQSLTKDGWIKAGDNWCYAKNNDLVKDDFVTVDGYTYYMDYYGLMQKDSEIDKYDSDTDTYKYYRVDEKGHLVTGWYRYDEGSDWYYYGADGVRAEGLTTINGKTYYFDSSMRTNYAVVVDGTFYYFGDNGVQAGKQSLDKDGWVKAGDGWYYIQNKEIVEDGFVTVDGYTYYMDYSGLMQKNTDFVRYDQDTDTYKYYRVDEKGHLVTGWYRYDEDSDWYYYGTDGVRAEGMTTVNGKTYYFDGWMRTDYAVAENGYLYYFGSNGVLASKQSISKDGWIKAGENWYYAKDKELVKDQLLTVGNYTYYLGYDGTMWTDNTFSIYDSENETDKYYRVDEKGHLVKGWYRQEGDSSWYYYDSEGVRADGITTINGKTYYFDEYMRCDYVVTEDGCLYYFGSDGVLAKKQSLTKDGWIQVNDNWYYTKNKSIVRNNMLTLNGITYFLDYDGVMQTNRSFQWYDEEDDEYYYYRVDEKGHLLRNAWYKSFYDDNDNDGQEGYWYYYDADGRRVKGLQTINGKTYYFSSYMLKDYVIAENGYFYYFGKDGVQQICKKMDKDQWIQVDNNWYYIKNKEMLQRKAQKIGKYIYVFDNNGKMAVNDTCWADDGDATYYYRTDASGHAITGWFYDESESAWYYYQKDGKAAEGVETVNNNKYYFSYEGRMETETAQAVDGVLYYFGSDGKVSASVSLKTDGWKKLPDGYYYSEKGSLLTGQFKKIGNSTYYFAYNGLMACDEIRRIEDNDGNEGVYRFDAKGHMVTGWYEAQNGWYYYEKDGHGTSGIQTINNKLYYLSDGEMQLNKKVIKNGKLYIFGMDGVGTEYKKTGWVNNTYYIENGKPVSGWKKISNKWYYFDSDSLEKTLNDRVMINGTYYYFDAKGEMKTGLFRTDSGEVMYAGTDGKLKESGWYKTSTGKWYYFEDAVAVTGRKEINGSYNLFRKDGTWIKAVSFDQTGWLKDNNGNYYYLENGKPLEGTTQKINGKTYIFDRDGVMKKDCFYGEYYLQASGAALTDGWAQSAPGIYAYFGKDGRCVDDGWKKINSKWYYFKDGVMNTKDKVIDGKLYKFASSGVSDGVGTKVAAGWNLIDGQYYYIKDGKMVENSVQTINGKKYYFDYLGRMSYANYVYVNDKYYYTNVDGSFAVNGWCNGGQCYAGKDGALYTGKQKIGGKTYLFSENGTLLKENVLSEDSKTIFMVDKNGAFKSTVTAQKDGWLKTSDGSWYYVKNGAFVRGRVLVINGKGYYFNYNGTMMTNTYSYGNGYSGSDGVLHADGWYDSSYFEDGTVLSNITQVIDGKYYLFRYGRNTSGVWKMDGEFYYFDGKGNRTIQNMKTGWNKVSGKWYYLTDEGNMLVDSIVKINNKFYRFNDDGTMMTNSIGYVYSYDGYGNPRLAYFDADGISVKNCWKTVNGQSYYFDANGLAVTGKRQINGKWYIFSKSGVKLQ